MFTNSITATQNWDWRLDLQSYGTISLLIFITMSFNIQIDNFVYHSDSEITILVSVSSKLLKYTSINLFIEKLSTLTIAKITVSTGTGFRMQKKWNVWEQLRCVAHSPLIVGMTKALLNLLGTCFVQTKCVLRNFAYKRRLSNLWKEVIISVLVLNPCLRCAIFPVNNEHFNKSWGVTKGITFLKRIKNQFKILLEKCFVQHAQT